MIVGQVFNVCGFEHFGIGVVGSFKKGVPAKYYFFFFFEFSKEFSSL